MKREKSFDCVEMKNAVQKQLNKEYDGLTDEEIRKRRLHKLETSDSPLARTWRKQR